ncbi:heat shock protein 30 family protein B homeolog f [Epichloe bromicola]|uniref:Heat shock protein 30 family protein B homeolog f n=1 Tax=Epichloe bromicola TaxID=79588 RepID=A0ABQ0CIK9_9HYPO
MHLRSLARPLAQLLTTTARCSAMLVPKRGHKTTARTKRALKIAPHDSFLPSRTAPFPAADTIIYNPPSSEASPAHTPFIFLPRGDPRRLALLRMRSTPGAPAPLNGEGIADADLPPQMRYKRRTARYHLTEEDVEEIRRLRAEDPIRWSVGKLAAKFECSEVFVKIVAPASQEHHEWLQGKLERKMARWGPKKLQAREDRKRRAEMVYRGEL